MRVFSSIERSAATIFSFFIFSGVGLKSTWSTPRSISGRLVATIFPRASVIFPRLAFIISMRSRAFSATLRLSGPIITCR